MIPPLSVIYCVGNALLPQDSLPLRIMPRLQAMFPDIQFEELEPTETMPDDRNLVIIDTSPGIEKVQVLHDLDRLIKSRPLSLHDFDLGLTLKLLQKAGKLDAVTIICVPMDMSKDDAIRGVSTELQKLR